MSVTVETSISGPYVPNGVTTAFAFDFKAASSTEVQVIQVLGDIETIVSDANYDVTLSVEGGGSVLFTTAPLTGSGVLYIVSEPDFTRSADFSGRTPFNVATVNDELDRGVVRDIALREEVGRAVKVPVGATVPDYADFTAAVKGDPGGSPQAIGTFTAAATHLGGAGFTIPTGIDLVATDGYSMLDVGAALYVYDPSVDAAYVAANPKSSFLSIDGRGFRLSKEQEATPAMFGFTGTSVSTDTAALQAAIDWVGARGGGTVDCSFYSTITVNATITIGNGTPTASSTVNNVFLKGIGGQSPFRAADLATTLKWAGAPGGTVLKFSGEMTGGGMPGSWIIDGDGIAATGLDICHLEGGQFGSIKIQKCTGAYKKLRTQTNPDTVGGCRNNVFQSYDTDVLMSGTTGLSLNGITTLFANVLQNKWGVVDLPIGADGAIGISLGYCDFNTFDVVDIGEQATIGTSVGIKLVGTGPTGNQLFPCMNEFGLVASGAPLVTDTAGGQPFANKIRMYDLADSYNHAVPTAVGFYGMAVTTDITGAQRRQLSFGMRGDGFNTVTPSLPALNTDVTNTNPYPVGIYMTSSSGSVVSGATVTDEHGTVAAMPTTLYIRLATGAKVKFTSAVPSAWKWCGE